MSSVGDSNSRTGDKNSCSPEVCLGSPFCSLLMPLPRVIAHKEDPSTHEKFVPSLPFPFVSSPRQDSSMSCAPSNLPRHTPLFSPLEDLLMFSGFGSRPLSRSLSSSVLFSSLPFQDVIAEKVRFSTLAATRVYPTIRRASFELYNTLRVKNLSPPHCLTFAAHPGNDFARAHDSSLKFIVWLPSSDR